MKSHRAFSTSGVNDQKSPLVAAFVKRLGREAISARQVICEHASALEREARLHTTGDFLEESAKLRRIVSIERQTGLNSDGFIEPLGSSLADGFRVVLRQETASNRQRFTLAHEICHTFFYEAAPEIKFLDYQEDSVEEALCNLGASCLLIPEDTLRESDLVLRPCLTSLEALAEEFKVSPETMIIRLRSLGLWKCEYSCWHRMTSGEFTLERLFGWRKIKWNWSDPSVLERAWHSGRLHRGDAVLWGQANSGDSTGKSVHYELKRRGELLVALWDERRLYEQRPPLLTVRKNHRRGGKRRAVPKPTNGLGVSGQAGYWWME